MRKWHEDLELISLARSQHSLRQDSLSGSLDLKASPPATHEELIVVVIGRRILCFGLFRNVFGGSGSISVLLLGTLSLTVSVSHHLAVSLSNNLIRIVQLAVGGASGGLGSGVEDSTIGLEVDLLLSISSFDSIGVSLCGQGLDSRDLSLLLVAGAVAAHADHDDTDDGDHDEEQNHEREAYLGLLGLSDDVLDPLLDRRLFIFVDSDRLNVLFLDSGPEVVLVSIGNEERIVVADGTDDGCAEEHILGQASARSQNDSSEFVVEHAEVFEVVLGVSDMELDHDGTFVNGDHLDISGFDSKNSSKSVGEADNTTIGEELVHGEFQSDAEHEGVAGHDVDFASGFHPELKTVDHTFISKLTTATSTGHWSPGLKIIIPVGSHDHLSVLIIDLVGTSVGVVNSHQESSQASLSVQLEFLLLRRRARVLDSDFSVKVNHGGESLLALLASVEAVPAFVHVGVQAVVVTTIVPNVDRLG